MFQKATEVGNASCRVLISYAKPDVSIFVWGRLDIQRGCCPILLKYFLNFAPLKNTLEHGFCFMISRSGNLPCVNSGLISLAPG